ncbi:TIGR03749 family integrating conjugative element protein [Pseudomonas batumici]|uniref:TIGR03749 family integrating conjugative element protein n=1 Tax=Pseudomonas batumici TaxID=226910 RepID=UPI0030CE47E9
MRRLNLLLPLWLSCTAAQAIELMPWARLPLAVPLYVDQERIVFIDQNVRVGVPRSLGDTLRIQSTGGTLYLRANAPIKPTRLHLQDVRTGEIILIDITATDGQGQPVLEPVKIVKASGSSKGYGDTAETSPSDTEAKATLRAANSPPASQQTPIPVVLTRYAAQNLYAPLRTVEPLPGVLPVKSHRDLDLTGLMPTQPVMAQWLGAWQLEDHTVSAVKLQNRAITPIALDPRELRGDFVSAAFQHPYLGPTSQASDTTVVYLVTRGRSLVQALPPALSSVDASTALTVATVPGGDHDQ